MGGCTASLSLCSYALPGSWYDWSEQVHAGPSCSEPSPTLARCPELWSPWQSSATLWCCSWLQGEHLPWLRSICARGSPWKLRLSVKTAAVLQKRKAPQMLQKILVSRLLPLPSAFQLGNMTKNSLLPKAPGELCCLITSLAFNFCSHECIQVFGCGFFGLVLLGFFFQIPSPSFNKKSWI